METLVGRGDELRQLQRVLEPDGRRAVVVSGAAGAGKSRLLAEVATTAEAQGWMVARIFASSAVHSIPLGAISHLLTDVPAADPAQVFHATIRHLRRKARERPLLLVVDDCHELDTGSAAFVRQLVMHGNARALLAFRTGSNPDDAVTALWKDGAGDWLELQPLSRESAAALAEQTLGARAEAALLDEAWRLTMGHPLYLLTGLRAARERHSVVLRGGAWRLVGPLVSEQLQELVLSRVRDLDEDARSALELVVLGGPIQLRLLEPVVPRDTLEVLTQAGTVTMTTTEDGAWVSVAHPLYAEAVLPTLTETRRRHLAMDLATAVLGDGDAAPVDRLRAAVWMLEAEQTVDEALALGAAREAMRRGDYGLAERLARAALAEATSTPAQILLGRALAFQGDGAQADAILVAVRPETDEEAAEVALARGHALAFAAGRPDDGAAVLLAASAGLQGELRARLDSERALYGAIAGDFHAVLDAAGAVLENTETPDLARLTAHVSHSLARAMTARLDGFDEATETALHLAQSYADDLPLAADQIGVTRVAGWTAAGRLEDSEHLAATRVREAETAGAPNPLWLAWLGCVSGQRGRFREAIAAQRQALSLLASSDPFRLHAQSVGLLTLHRAQSRSLEPDSGERLAQAEREAAGETRLAVWIGRAWVWVAAAEGRLRAAAEKAAEVGTAAIAHDHISWGVQALHDATRLRHPALVRAALEEAVAATRGARLLEVMGDHTRALDEEDTDALRTAAVDLGLCGSPLLAAEAWAQLSRLHDQRREAHASRRSALCATLWQQQCPAAETPALEGPDGLSAREVEVVQRASAGLPSRGIADELFVSVRTVDNHLHAAYRKLGIAGRDELAAFLAEYGP